MSDNNATWTIGSCLAWTEQRLAQNHEENPRLAAQWLLSYATGLQRIELYMHFDKPMSDEQRRTLRDAIQRRERNEPLQYITGKAQFRYIELNITPGVLIPRPETELLVDLVAQTSPHHVLEIGTGSGAIALALLHELPNCCVVATDIAPEAIALTSQNAAKLGLNDPERLTLLQDDLATSFQNNVEKPTLFDAVVSNPPYVPSLELLSLPDEVKDYEPMLALDGGADGLELFRRILPQAYALLNHGGLLAVELHETRLEAASELAENAGFHDVTTHFDLTNRPRFLTATR